MRAQSTAVLILLVTSVVTAHAQDSVPVQPIRDERPDSDLLKEDLPANTVRLEEIIVTATKRQEAERDVPLSIDSLKGQDLERQGATGLEQILQNSPGVNIQKGGSVDKNYVSIRGVSSDSRNNIYTRPTGLFLEDASLTNPSTLSVLADVDLIDISRVEILKGPQGTLFGGSALSGLIRYLPNQPTTAATLFKVSVGSGFISDSDDRPSHYSAMINLPIGENLALRAAGGHRNTPGFVDDSTSGEKDINKSESDQVRGALLWQPLPELTLSGSYFTRKVHSDNGGILDDVENRQMNVRRVSSNNDSTVRLSDLRGEYEFNAVKLVALYSRLQIEGYDQADLSPSLGLSATPVRAYQPSISTVDQPTYELRLVSNEPLWGVNYLFGYYNMRSVQYLNMQTTVDALSGIGAGNLVPASVFQLVNSLANSLGATRADLSRVSSDVVIDADAREKAFFFDLSRTFFDDFTLNLGGRFFDATTDGKTVGEISGIPEDPAAFGLDPGEYGLPTLRTPLNATPVYDHALNRFNPKVAVTWKPGERFSAYGSAVKGFRFGGINTIPAAYAPLLDIPVNFKSDTLWNYEAGIRTDWFDGRMTADLTAFYIDWKDLQVLQTKASIFGYTDNVGSARSKGAELDIKTLLPHGFLLNLSGAFVDARTTEDFDSDSGTVAAGTPLPATPRWSGAGTLTHIGKFWGVSTAASYMVSYRGESPNRLQNDIPLEAYMLHNISLNLGLRDRDLQPEINFSVTNLLDESVSVFALNTAGGVLRATNQPRTFLVTLSLSY